MSGMACLANGRDLKSIWGCLNEGFMEEVVSEMDVTLCKKGLQEEGNCIGESKEEGRCAGVGRASL